MEAHTEQTPELMDAQQRIRELSNDALIIELINTLNHLSRWLTPIHDWTVLDYALRRSERSVKQILAAMHDTEARAYSFMHAITTMTNPDLDKVPRIESPLGQDFDDRAGDALVTMAGFRRVRESSTSLLRALPDTAWHRSGFSRTDRDWTIRELAESLAVHDWRMLGEIDHVLARSGARAGIATVSRVSFEQIDAPFLPVLDLD